VSIIWWWWWKMTDSSPTIKMRKHAYVPLASLQAYFLFHERFSRPSVTLDSYIFYNGANLTWIHGGSDRHHAILAHIYYLDQILNGSPPNNRIKPEYSR
jgi:hypothetical protein